jgi:prephenate dehydrogenase
LAVAERLFSTLGMETIFMDAREHDLHAAYVSHISHITSFVLSLTVLEQEKDRQSIFDMAAGGFESTVRLANSSAEMWTPIFEQNAEHLSTVIATCIDKLESFKKHIENKDTNEITSLIKEANKITKVLGEKKPSAGTDDFKSEYLL